MQYLPGRDRNDRYRRSFQIAKICGLVIDHVGFGNCVFGITTGKLLIGNAVNRIANLKFIDAKADSLDRPPART